MLKEEQDADVHETTGPDSTTARHTTNPGEGLFLRGLRHDEHRVLMAWVMVLFPPAPVDRRVAIAMPLERLARSGVGRASFGLVPGARRLALTGWKRTLSYRAIHSGRRTSVTGP